MGKKLALKLVGMAALAMGSLAVGCGTVCNLAGGLVHPEEEPKVYGGVQRDLDIIGKMNPLSLSGGGQNAAMGAAFILGVVAVDPVLSLVGDTLTLPITMLAQQWREAKEQSEHEAKAIELEEPAVEAAKSQGGEE